MFHIAHIIDKNALIQHKEKALKTFGKYIDTLISSENFMQQGKADKLSYWMEDWTTFLSFEPHFNPSSLRRYKRGEIVKIHLGFNVGSEDGGLHYAVVVDKSNSINSPVITVVPLTSVKPHTNIKRLHRGSVFLGNELFIHLSSKISALDRRIEEDIAEIQKAVPDFKTALLSSDNELRPTLERFERFQKEHELLQRTRKEVSRMKTGSIALVNQIRTISKIRIYDPKTNYDVLSGVKLSNEKLDLIDNEIISLYTGQ